MTDQLCVILGATSAVGQAVARQLAQEGLKLCLIARDEHKLSIVAQDLRARDTSVETHVLDFDDCDSHEALIKSIDGSSYWVFYGSLPDQKTCEEDWQTASKSLHTNFISVASLLTHIANSLEVRGAGSIVVMSSVAGDRGRKSNYIYGSAKGALSLFCQGLRNRLAASGVQLMTVKPGFIDTPMTSDIPKTPAVLWASPEQVANDMVSGWKKKKDVIYTRWFWFYILLIIKSIPERIFKKMSL